MLAKNWSAIEKVANFNSKIILVQQ